MAILWTIRHSAALCIALCVASATIPLTLEAAPISISVSGIVDTITPNDSNIVFGVEDTGVSIGDRFRARYFFDPHDVTPPCVPGCTVLPPVPGIVDGMWDGAGDFGFTFTFGPYEPVTTGFVTIDYLDNVDNSADVILLFRIPEVGGDTDLKLIGQPPAAGISEFRYDDLFIKFSDSTRKALTLFPAPSSLPLPNLVDYDATTFSVVFQRKVPDRLFFESFRIDGRIVAVDVPEPSTVLLLGTGFALCTALADRRRRRGRTPTVSTFGHRRRHPAYTTIAPCPGSFLGSGYT